MKLLRELLYKAGIEQVIGSTNVAIESIAFDSRNVTRFSLFVAVKGELVDGHKFISSAIEKGAIAIVCEDLPETLDEKINYVVVKNTSLALAQVAANYYDNPSEHIKLVGVTGTNGKTTSTTLLYNLFRALGYKVGLISTVSIHIDKEIIPSTHTTPDSLSLQKLLRQMIDAGCTYCFMEVSSHAVTQNRIAATSFTGAAFTNLTHDHLDYHKTFDNYLKAKKKFFDQLPEFAFALVNKDDRNGEVMLQNTRARKYTYALKNSADFKVKLIENSVDGLHMFVDSKEVWTKLIGSFNAYNFLLAYSVAVLLKEDKNNVLTLLSNLQSAEGRFQYVKSKSGIIGIIDYAHTPDALDNVLETIKDIKSATAQVISVVGCGGDRDPFKRPLMAEIASKKSDKAILTSDNPRSEDPAVIIDQMKAGVPKDRVKNILAVVDRREAIKTAVSLAKPGDIVLVAGKGHEKYQEVKGIKSPFDDKVELENVFLLFEN